ncbi:pmpB [Symbiodinium sp. CCMP2592]|nr:pmpB [Symbiodinium sp. CCMP2592]
MMRVNSPKVRVRSGVVKQPSTQKLRRRWQVRVSDDGYRAWCFETARFWQTSLSPDPARRLLMTDSILHVETLANRGQLAKLLCLVRIFAPPAILAQAMKSLKSAFPFLHWRGRRAGCLAPFDACTPPQASAQNRFALSLTGEDKPPRAIGHDHLAAMVEAARIPRSRECRHAKLTKAEYDYWYRSTLGGWARTAAGKIRLRDKRKGRESNVDAEHLLDLVLEQGGLCSYSGIPMELLKPNSHWRVSVERKDVHHGYIRGNCCLIAAEFNSIVHKVSDGSCSSPGTTQWSEEKVQEVVHVRTRQLQMQQLQEDIATARQRPHIANVSRLTFRGPDAESKFRCNCCGVWQLAENFYSDAASTTGLRSRCKKCCCGTNSVYRQTMRGHALSLLAGARYRSAKGKSNGRFTLELDDLLDMLLLQGGRCYYSGVPLHCATGPADWVWSIERLDNAVTYTKENCVLIAQEFQTPDQSRNKAKFPVFGTAQWSRRKASYVWGPFFPEDGLSPEEHLPK